ANAGSATLVFDMVTLSDNVAMSGGGISNGGRTYLQNSTVSGNRAEGNDSLGGGIHNFQVLELFQSTVAENSASKGGGIHNEKIAYLFNALVANNEGGDCYLLEKPHSFGSNLDSDSSCRLVGKFGDISGVEPRLGPLADYGGTTKTHRLMPGSPAIDAGKTYLSFSSDQRGLLRPQGQGWDIGAVEFEGFSIAPILFPLLLD
ncbi:MAG: hypothetical protein GY702_17185, partial [Desulfobulbaceae bacterium]|nr:hypothetical protein [Desulfobulbaceae bacterium]